MKVYADLGLSALPLDADGNPLDIADDPAEPGADQYLVCIAERDLPGLLPVLGELRAG